MFTGESMEFLKIVTRNRRECVMFGVPFHVPKQEGGKWIDLDATTTASKVISLGLLPHMHRVVYPLVIPAATIESGKGDDHDQKPVACGDS